MIKDTYHEYSGVVVINKVTKIHPRLTITFKCTKEYET